MTHRGPFQPRPFSDSVILEVFSNLNDSIILQHRFFLNSKNFLLLKPDLKEPQESRWQNRLYPRTDAPQAVPLPPPWLCADP